MNQTVAVLCTTFLVVLVVYWIMPTKKMKAVNEALKSLVQVLPITKIVTAIINNSTKGKSDDVS